MTPPPDPIFLATAVEIVLRSGEIQNDGRASGFRISKKGEIDLVTEVDLACERMCRQVLAERFPEHDILAEELSSGPGEAARARYRWVFDPVDGTTNYAHGLPIFCSSLALELDGQPIVGAIYDPTRRELFTAERGQGAFLDGTPLGVSGTDALGDALLVTEAGGRLTGMDGGVFDARAGHLVASNGRVHQAMLEVIIASRAGRTLRGTV